ncbi:MAG: hypothetical protein II005_00425 [Turicibacter sp.]|nr:hypothetical protein [Turicibacter sp.]
MEVISSIYNSGYNIKKFYLGSRELNLAYLGNQVIYDEVIGDNDLNYILYEFYGSDTLPNTVEAPVKRAILKGQTLVNRITSHGFGGNNQVYESRLFDQPFNTGDIFTVFVVNPNVTTVVIGFNNSVNDSWMGERRYDVPSNKKITVTVPSGAKCKYMGVVVPNRNDSTGFENSLVAVEGDQTHLNVDTYFEGMQSVRMPTLTTSNGDDTKTNILTVNELVELRGIGNVKDELNCLTGEVTERIKEVVLNGSENWVRRTGGTSYAYFINNFFGHNNVEGITSSFKFIKGGAMSTQTQESICSATTQTALSLFTNKHELSTVENLKTYLSRNPVTIQYKLEAESTKTVDLTIVDQDGETINKLNSFNGTTYVSTEVAENSTYPIVSLEVASELQAAMSKVAEDIELIKPVQNDIETTLDTQSNDIDSLLLATTELFEMFL